MTAPERHHSAVCAIARDEDRYALEWAAYHLALGFDHVFLYDNLSDRPLATLFDPRDAHPFVTVTLWPTLPGRNPQLEAYGHFLASYGRAVDWVAFLDLDEMLHLKRHAGVRAFLADRAGADGVAVNWRVFGSAGEARYRPGLAMVRFTRASALEFDPNRLVKTIARTDRVASPAYHHVTYARHARVVAADGAPVANESVIPAREASFAVAQVNHYFVRSREEWGEKVRRGYADGTVRPLEMFADYDRNEVEDRSILVRRRDTERWMRRIGAKRRAPWRRIVGRV